MKPGIPWSVKGIGSEAREAAKDAARRSGMTLGEWLNSVILEQTDDLSRSSHVAPARSRPATDTAIRLEDLAHQLARLTQKEQDTTAGLAYEQGPMGAFDTGTLERISTRVESNERQSLDAFAAVNERLNSISQQLNDSNRVWQPSRPEDVPGYQALEGALRNIVEHIEISEKRTREQLRTMQDRMSDLSQRAASSTDSRITQNAQIIVSLENRLNDLAFRVEKSESATRNGLSPALENQLAQLAERIESVRQSSESAIQRAQTVAVQAARGELEEVESRIQTLLADTQGKIGNGAAPSPDLSRLHGEIESLNQRIDDLRADSASERDLNALKQAIEQLSARLAQGPDMRSLSELAQKLDQSRDVGGIGSQLGDIENRIRDLDERLSGLMQGSQDTGAFRGFEQHIASLSDRLAAAEQQFGHIGTLERSIGQLFESIEQSRNWTHGIAEDAANRMAERLMEANPAWSNQQEKGPSPELRALEEGLAAVRASAEASDQRNQDTLVALHETLERIVEKLAEFETAVPASIVPPPSTAGTIPLGMLPETPVLPELPNLQPPPRDQRDAGLDVFGVPHTFSTAEPVRTAEPAAISPQQATPSLDEPASDVESNAPPADDFIAAARRAAQAAQQNAKKGTNDKLGKAVPKEKGRRFGLPSKFSVPFRAQAKSEKPKAEPVIVAAKPVPPVLPAPKQGRGNAMARKAPLIIAGLVLLAAVAAISFKQFAGMRATPAMQTQSQSQAPIQTPSLATAKQLLDTLTSKVSAAVGQPIGTMPSPDVDPELGKTSAMEKPKSEPLLTDEILTSALPAGKSDATLGTIVAEPGQATHSAITTAVSDMPRADVQPESLRQAAAGGNAAAQFIVASRYLDGQSVQQDFAEAARWYQKAASQGLAPAQYRIATLFERGKGVPLDMATARVWYERAAEGGNVRAMHNVAVIYASAQSEAPSYDKAARWFAAAASYGLRDSQFNLAVLYERGMGVQKSLGDALFWYSMAASQDDQDARKRADALAKSLPAATVSEIRERISGWKVKPAPQDANVVAINNRDWQLTDHSVENDESSTAPQISEDLGSDVQQIQSSESDQPASTASTGPVETIPPAASIERAQKLLAKQGFNIGEPDGKMGARTVNAIRLFELKSGMRVTGKVTDQLLDKLETAPVKPPA